MLAKLFMLMPHSARFLHVGHVCSPCLHSNGGSVLVSTPCVHSCLLHVFLYMLERCVRIYVGAIWIWSMRVIHFLVAGPM